MHKKGHIIVAFVLNFMFIYFTIYLGWKLFDLNEMNIFILTSIIILYSLMPDIDHRSAGITWFFLGIGILGLLLGFGELALKTGIFNPFFVLVWSVVFIILVFISPNIFKHRGFIHSMIFGLLAVLPLFLLFESLSYCLVAYLSWHSHLIADVIPFKVK